MLVLLGVVAMWRVAPVPTVRVRAATSGVIAAPPYSIAVLPFTNMSSDKDQDYFAEGISKDLLNLLPRVQPSRLAARTSSFALQGKGLDIPEIAARLHVANVLEGSVRKAGDEVRITAQLVRASDGYEIWSKVLRVLLTNLRWPSDISAGGR
jgi:TolB-like protein